jgi:hypothetical protein
MNHAEYGGVEAYAEGKGENGYRRKSEIAPQRSQRMGADPAIVRP